MLLMLLGRERVLVRVAVPRPLSRRGNAIRLGISHEPGDERQRRVASRGHPRRREEEAPGLVVVEDPSRAGLPAPLPHGRLSLIVWRLIFPS